MKKMLYLIVLVALGTTTITAQDQNQDKDQDQDQVRLMLVDGDVLQIRDRDQIRLKDKVTLTDGTVINPDGSYLTRDRAQLRLKDGECLDMNGIKYNNEYQYQFMVKQNNKGLSEDQIQQRSQNRTHFMLVDGEMLQIKNQSQNRLQQKLTLQNGIVVNPNGVYQTRERKQLQLKDGECLNMSGEMFKNTYQHRKMILQKNMMKNKVQMKPNVQKKTMKKGNVIQ
ncbi:DUF6799 domain-containing protein [Yeosuana sp.]|uniref:DUF6799 domain-containing protein n=1 Tax=Yeosuana sp. TaxID=2529388 RepID=UPI0040550E7F